MTGLEYLLQKQSKFILIFALFSSSFIFSEAIVNVEDLRRDGEKGFFANISGSLSFSRGNRNRDSFSIQSSLDYNVDDLETFFVVKRSQKKINQKNVLTVYCSDANLFELSYSTLEIKEKINGFFLRNVVDIIKFKKLLQT